MTRIVKVIRRGRLKKRGGGGGGEDENKDDGCCGGYLCGWLHGANNDVNNVTEVFPIEQIVYSCIRGRERFMRQIARRPCAKPPPDKSDVYFSRSSPDEILYNKEIGHLLRTKNVVHRDGGVASGRANLDNPLLTS